MWAIGLLGYWAIGLLGYWAIGLLGYWAIGYWAIGLLGYWAIGLLGYWAIGLLGYWAIGLLGYWAIGLLGYWAIGDLDRISSTLAKAMERKGMLKMYSQTSTHISPSSFCKKATCRDLPYSYPWYFQNIPYCPLVVLVL
ncbi:hypothetical protein [Anaplasma phagocytophilum]|uniref:hypothetical protein n=1 Tax=Anaplasma phagocytophilum TaxID=948 RepID=UPI000A63F1A0|nr:hypothetical protein [Anaplasma phagocytophilum]